MKAAWKELTPRQKSYAAAAGIGLAIVVAGYGVWQFRDGADDDVASGSTECEDVLYWYDPMVPGQRFDEPGPSPFMDMALVPKCAGETAGAGGVSIDPTLVQNLGIRTAEAEFGILEPDVTVTGVLSYNESDVAIVQPRAGGYVERTYGLAPQDVVSKGAPLVDILVPEWGGAQREYIAVLGTGNDELASASRQRLLLLGMSASLIARVTRTREPHSTITVSAPISGAITELVVRPGMTVSAGQTLAQVAGFTPIWLEAAVPETLAAEVRAGQPITATLTAFPGENFTGQIIAILPSAADKSRTITVRAALSNPGRRLKPGMFAQVSLVPQSEMALLVPSEAVIRTGERTIVMLAQKAGGYRPAEVRIGREAKGRTQILAGLVAGEKVVSSGQFLLDSEASLAGLDVRPIDEAPTASSSGDRKTDENVADTYTATGTINAITAQKITLKHGPVPALSWPAMTMGFATKGPAQVRGFKRGDRVTFTFTQSDAGPRIVSIRRTGQ